MFIQNFCPKTATQDHLEDLDACGRILKWNSEKYGVTGGRTKFKGFRLGVE
jgi:hypothetical protein